jgi:hypothetical protein
MPGTVGAGAYPGTLGTAARPFPGSNQTTGLKPGTSTISNPTPEALND